MSVCLSILLPTHNRCDTLALALESLFAQPFTDWEVLVVGDGCSDGTAELMRALQKKDSRVRWFDLPKGIGFGYANRNIALSEANGKLIGFMSDDDLVFGDHLGRLVALMQDEEAHLGVMGSLWADEGGQMVPTIGPLHDEGYLDAFMAGENRLPALGFIHRRSVFDEIGYWDADLERCGDLDLWQRIIKQKGKLAIRTDPRCNCVHFRAPWKRKGVDANPHDVGVWQTLMIEERLDKDLLIKKHDGEKLQESLWRRLLEKPVVAKKIEVSATRALETYAYAAMEWVVRVHEELKRVHEDLNQQRERAEHWKHKQRLQIERAERWKQRAER